MVHTEKHVTQHSLFSVGSGALTTLTIASALQDHDPAVANNVREGCTISAVYCEIWLSSDDAASGTAICTLERRPGGVNAMIAAESAALNSYDNKKNVLYTFQGLLPSNVQFPMPSIKGWIKIPKGKQRFGIGDKLVFNIHGQSNGVAGCGFFIYKEQY